MSPDQTVQLFTLNLTQHDRLRRSRHGSLHAVRSVIIASLEMRLRTSLQNSLLTGKAWARWVRHFRRSELVPAFSTLSQADILEPVRRVRECGEEIGPLVAAAGKPEYSAGLRAEFHGRPLEDPALIKLRG